MRTALLVSMLLVPLVSLAAGKPAKPAAKAAPKVEEKADGPLLYALFLDTTQGIAFDVFLNDVLVRHGDGSNSMMEEMVDVNDWVMPGANTLHVKLSSADPKHPVDPEFARGTVRIAAAAKGKDIFDAPSLAAVDLESAKGKLPLDKQVTLQVTRPPRSDLWTRAQPLTLDDATKTSALQFINEVYGAYQKRDPDRMLALSSFKVADTRQARQWSAAAPDALRKLFAEELQDIKVPPLEPEKLTLQVVGAGKLVWVSRAGKPFLAWKEDDGESTVELYLAQLDGQWTVVR